MKARGFTLLEVLVAVAVFAVAATLAYGGLDALARHGGHLRSETERLATLRRTMSALERDVRQALPRAVRDAQGQGRPALRIADLQLELSVLHGLTQLQGRTLQLERIVWRHDDRQLLRGRHAPPEALQGTEVALLEEVTQWRVRALDRDRQWHDRWPPPDAPDAWPIALELRVQAQGFGEIRRLLELAQRAAPVDRPLAP